MSKISIICLTPVKNEEWILDKFIMAASLWADCIIIADQNSTDNSRLIAKKYKKVILLENGNNVYDESKRKEILLAEARKIQGDKILIALDADEFLSGNFNSEKEWDAIKSLERGTIIEFPWVNISPTLDKYWFSNYKPFGFIDDNISKAPTGLIHTERLPSPEDAPTYRMKKIFTMHFQYVDWKRMESKQRWYQCWERINRPRSAIDIYRMYHHMYSIKDKNYNLIPNNWFEIYEKNNIYLKDVCYQDKYWWDSLVLDLMGKFGCEYFKKEAIWNIDWKKIAISNNRNPGQFSDSRSILDKLIQAWLKATQYSYNTMTAFRYIDTLLKKTLKY